VTLHVPAVLEPQGAEFVVGQPAGQMALELIAVLRSALAHEAVVEVGVDVHRQWKKWEIRITGTNGACLPSENRDSIGLPQTEELYF
jgi:hypothetical protein